VASSQGKKKKDKKRGSAYLFLRDAAVAAILVAGILLAMFAYTGQWPPLVVVESNSMMHSEENLSEVGVIDTGDLVLVKEVDAVADIETYVDGFASGHRTYGDYGDVVVYKVNGQDIMTPIIHRAMIYLEANPDGESYRAESLQYLPVSKWSASDPADNWTSLTSVLTIHDVGYRHASVVIDISHLNGAPYLSGFITKGDHNPSVDQSYGSNPVHITWVVGKARGEIPWFGLLKLWTTGTLGSPAPQNSVTDLWVSLILIILLPVIIDIVLTYREKRMISKKRKADAASHSSGEKTEAEDPAEPVAGPTKRY
jgi:signal peptidase